MICVIKSRFVSPFQKAGANPWLKDKAGRNSLHWAAHHGHVKCLKSLLNSKLAMQTLITFMEERDNVSNFNYLLQLIPGMKSMWYWRQAIIRNAL